MLPAAGGGQARVLNAPDNVACESAARWMPTRAVASARIFDGRGVATLE